MIIRAKLNNRRGTVYIAVMGVALIMGVVSVTAMQVARIQLRTVTMVDEMAQARLAAQSAVELGLSQIELAGASWRNSLTSDLAVGPFALGNGSSAMMSWMITDSDGDLMNDDTELSLYGIGSVGDAIKVNQVLLNIDYSSSESADQILRSYTELSSFSEQALSDNKWYGQNLQLALPATAVGWRVTGVDLYLGSDSPNEIFSIRIYTLNPSSLPETEIDSLELNSRDYETTPTWHTFRLSGDQEIDPTDEICIALETSASNSPINVGVATNVLAESNSALITGDPNWNTIETDKALLYRVHGVYWTGDGTVEVIPGSWKWVANP